MKNPTPESEIQKTKAGLTRRRFLETTVGTAMAGSLLPHASAWAADARNGIPYRTLGHTGEKVSCIGLGGYHIGMQATSRKASASSAPRSTKASISWTTAGTTTTAKSEIRMGKALRDGYRKKAFLMTKIDGRTKKRRRQTD